MSPSQPSPLSPSGDPGPSVPQNETNHTLRKPPTQKFLNRTTPEGNTVNPKSCCPASALAPQPRRLGPATPRAGRPGRHLPGNCRGGCGASGRATRAPRRPRLQVGGRLVVAERPTGPSCGPAAPAPAALTAKGKLPEFGQVGPGERAGPSRKPARHHLGPLPPAPARAPKGSVCGGGRAAKARSLGSGALTLGGCGAEGFPGRVACRHVWPCAWKPGSPAAQGGGRGTGSGHGWVGTSPGSAARFST